MIVTAHKIHLKKPLAAAAVAGAAFAGIATTAVGTAPQADASALAWCAPGPVDSRLEAECTNNDAVPATVNMQGLCTNLRVLGGQWRLMPRETIHVTNDCGPGANPILWSGDGESDHEEQQRQWQEHQQEEREHQENR